MKIIIDRIEGDFAVIEMPDKSVINVPILLFDNAREGDIYIIQKSTDTTEREHMKNLVNKLFTN